MVREYTARETRWVVDYIREHFPKEFDVGRVEFQKPVGPLAGGFSMRAAPRVDAVIYEDDGVVLLEAETENITSAIGQLEFYRSIWLLTPNLNDEFRLVKRAILLLESFDSSLAAFAASRGIEVSVWAPEWLKEYLVEKRGNRRRE